MYCPTATRKTLNNRVASSRRIEERMETGIKINRNIWQTKRTSLGEEFVFDRSTKRNETSDGSICAKRNKAVSFTPKMQWNIPFPKRPPPLCLVSEVFLLAVGQQTISFPSHTVRVAILAFLQSPWP
ncbi:hypothetical protein AVEN_198820-1 [Araneus ventricosus]|uniref:Uncharacterized protein n=1 Tax=Araneus ventricosus TaxID=182803 RepID=A0A4Y2HTM0_ARAVE|nr:hypothetical protein AVEN_198820-1 [Araneus ventricosus]